MGKHLSDAVMIGEAVRLFGAPATARLFGWLMVAAMSGVERRDDLVRVEWASYSTRQRVAMDVRQLRELLAAKGYDLTEDQVMERVWHPDALAGA